MKKNVNVLSGAVLASLLCVAPMADAALSIQLQSGASQVTVADGDDGTVNGIASYIGAVGGWTINNTTGYGVVALGNPWADVLDLFSFNATSSAPADDLTVMLTETDLARLDTSYATHVGGTTDGVVRFESYLDSGNGAFALTDLMADTGLLSGGSYSVDEGGSVSSPTPYSWTIVATISHSGTGLQSTSFDYNVKIPEPGTMALFGLGMLGLGFAARHGSKKKV